MHLLIIRHGQSKNNMIEAAHGAGDVFNTSRSVDPPLSDMGERQAQLLGDHLGAQLAPVKGRVRMFCSSMTRAVQTAAPLAEALGLRPMVRPGLFEVGGFYSSTSGTSKPAQGPGRAELASKFPGFECGDVPEEGETAETMAQAMERCRAFASSLEAMAEPEEAREQIVVVISHNDFISLLVRQLLIPSGAASLDTDAHENKFMFRDSFWPMNNTAISHLVLGVRAPAKSYPVGAYMLYYNRSDHLSESLRSGIQFKNFGALGAGEWARVGEGGSGQPPLFDESKCVAGVGAAEKTGASTSGAQDQEQGGGRQAVAGASLLQTAIERGFSSDGEIFDIHHLASLAAEVCGLRAAVMLLPGCEGAPAPVAAEAPEEQRRPQAGSERQAGTALGLSMKLWLSSGGVAVVPYDKDEANHQPALKGGKSAHYALVCGLATRGHEHVGAAAAGPLLVCVHGLSRRPLVLAPEELAASNAQLLEMRRTGNSKGWVVGGSGVRLTRRVLLLR